MLPALRRSLAPVAVLALLLAVAAPVAAAEPPAGVLLDGTLTVTVVVPDVGGGPASPLAGAEVTVVAYVNDFDDPFHAAAAETDAGGVAIVTGVPRPDAGGPPVLLAVTAQGPTVMSDDPETGCSTETSHFGLAQDVASASSVAVTVEAFPASSTTCPPRFLLSGSIVDASGAAVDARVSISLEGIPDGPALAFPAFDALGGAYELLLPEEYSGYRARFTVSVVGLTTRQEPFGTDCMRTIGEQGAAEAERAAGEGSGGGELQPIDVVTASVVLGENCGAIGGPSTSTPTPTLPPTDLDGAAEPTTGSAVPAPATGSAVPALAAVLALVAVVAAVAFLVPAPVRARR